MNLITPPLGAGIGSLDGRYLQSGGTTFTNGSVLFASGGNAAQNNANLFWDNTNKGLVIGGSSLTNTTNSLQLTGINRIFQLDNLNDVRWLNAARNAYGTRIFHDDGNIFFLINNAASGTGAAFVFQAPNGTTRLYIRADGNVGIGTASPNTLLDLDADADTAIIRASSHSLGGTGQLQLRSSRGTSGSPVLNNTGDAVGYLRFYAYDGANYLESARINGTLTGTVASTRVPSILQFSTSTDAAPSVLTERMRIDSAGNVGIGIATPQAVLDVNGATQLRGNLTWFTDTNNNIGAAASGRPNNVYVGNQMFVAGAIIAGTTGTPSPANPVGSGGVVRTTLGNIVYDAGTVLWVASNSTTALQIANATGTVYVNFDSTNQRVGIGTTSPGALLTVGANSFQVDSSGRIGGFGTAINTTRGITLYGQVMTGTDQVGVFLGGIASSAATGSLAQLFIQPETAAAAFTVGTGIGIDVRTPTIGASSAITTNYGIIIRNQGRTGITNAVGLQVDAQSGASSTNYAAIFAGGNVGIGTTSPAAALDVGGTLQINTGRTIYTNVTNSGILIRGGTNAAGVAGVLSLQGSGNASGDTGTTLGGRFYTELLTHNAAGNADLGRLWIGGGQAQGAAGILSAEPLLFSRVVAMALINDSAAGVQSSAQIYSPVAGQLGLVTGNGLNVAPVERIRIDTSGNVGIGTASPNANAILDLTSTTKAFMPPRMTTTQRDAVASPTAGMVIYNSTTNKLNVYTTVWEGITSS